VSILHRAGADHTVHANHAKRLRRSSLAGEIGRNWRIEIDEAMMRPPRGSSKPRDE